MADAKPRYLQPTMPHGVAEHLLICLGDISASVKGNKTGLARVPIASVFASRAICYLRGPCTLHMWYRPLARCHSVPITNPS